MDSTEIQEIVTKIRSTDKPIQTLFDITVQALGDKKRIVALLKLLIEWL